MNLLVVAVILLLGESGAAGSPQTSQGKPILLGVVTVVPVPAGEETSASVVPDPQSYADIPGLQVMAFEVPPAQAQLLGKVATDNSSANRGANRDVLQGVVVDMGDGRKQTADKPLSWVPPTGTADTIRLFLRNSPERPIATGTVPVEETVPPDSSRAISDTTPTDPPAYRMPSVTSAGGVEVIHGDTAGNANEMKIAMDGTAADIIAAKPGTVYWKVPDTAATGLHEVLFSPGAGRAPVKLSTYVIGLQMTADRTHMLRGQSTEMRVAVTGLEGLPSSAWHSEPPPSDLMDVGRWEKRTGLQAPKASAPGTVFLVLENESPETVRMGKHGTRVVLELHERDFAKGAYVWTDKLQSLQSGGFSIHGTVTAFLKQAVGEPI